MDNEPQKIQDDISMLNARINKLNLQRQQVLNEYLDLKGNIRVFCRIRPLLGDEIYSNKRPVVSSDSSAVFLKITDRKSKQYNFDKVFHPHSTQDEVFSEIEPLIKSALDGYNVCIFAYGQTGTGKTYTMEGRLDCPGVVPRGIEALFEQARESNYRLQFTFSMLEIYMGSLRDLLVPDNRKLMVRKAPWTTLQTLDTSNRVSKTLRIKYQGVGLSYTIQMDPKGAIEIENLAAIQVSDFNQVKELYKLGSRIRSTAPTMSNSTSSRSHCLIRISITCAGTSGRRQETNKIWMVDLGGSERLSKTRATGTRLKEGKAINLSLSALGDVISALQSKKPHVPYRNSKLTQVLRDSLGSDSKTLMLVHVSPKEEDICETVCSLGFATRAKSICLGGEEPTEVRAKKELAMAELLQKVKDFESESQDVARDIERLNRRLKHLMGTKPESEGNLEAHTFMERIQPNRKDMKPRARGSTRNPADLPRFMRPTICSRRRSGTEHQVLLSSRKPPIPPKKVRPSSVDAESVTYPAKGGVWQHEHGSACSISSISQFNWNNSEYDGTESSQEASEYEIKKVIFPEAEKSPCSSKISLSDEIANELEDDEASRVHQKNNFVIDNWLQLQMKEQNSSFTQWNKRFQAIPTDAKSLNSDTNDNLDDFRKKLQLYETVEKFDEAMITEGTHEKTDSDMTDKEHNGKNDSDQTLKCIDEEKPECTSRSDKTEADSETFLTERGTPLSQENSILGNTSDKDLIGSTKDNGDTEKGCLLSMRSRRSLLVVKHIVTHDQKSAAQGESAIHIGYLQEGRRKKGTSYLFGETFQTLWASVLLGMGIRLLGFEDDFFQALIF